jgi:MFS family permease
VTLVAPAAAASSSGLGGLARWLVLTQLLFNVGFYLVMPFLAFHLRDELGLSPWVVGLVIGVRTFSQQGLFVLGGVVTDQLGARSSAITGCLLRVAGFVVLGMATGLAGVLVGAVLTGVAGALFSPAVESCLAHTLADGQDERVATERRRTGFAAFAVAGEIGAMTGPLVGALVLGVGFRTGCLAAAAVFAAITLAHVRWLPPGSRHADEPLANGLLAVGRNRAFVVFAVSYSSYLLAYNQLYFLVPDALGQSAAPAAAAQTLAGLLTGASVVIAICQLPWTRVVGRMPASHGFVIGFGLMAAGALAAAWGAHLVGTGTSPALWWVGPAGFVALLTVGQMTLTPLAAAVAADFAREEHLGTHLGALASAGGVAALAGTPLLGWAGTVGGATLPWLCLAGACLASAAVLRGTLRCTGPCRA